ncbi:carotenoid oxygenase [Blastocladiella britannica]|nr:carotenoid oxygenase [Blastocladiella britannica]
MIIISHVKINLLTAQSGDPCKSFFKKFFTISLAVPTEFNVNVAVTPHFPRRDPTAASGWRNVLLAKTDANILQELDPTTLQPKGYTTYTAWNPQLSGIMTSAHEHFDTNTGEYINFLQEPGPVIRTRVFTINPALAAGGEVVCTIVTRLASYMHSFAVTDKYIVLIACPYYWTMGGIPIVFTQQVASALEWHGHLPVSFYVIDRATRRHVATYQGDSFFVFHIINSFDLARGGGGPSTAPPASFSSGATPAAATGGSHNEDDDIVIDLCAYRTPNNIQEMYLDKFRTGTTNFEASHVRRYTLRNVRQVAQDQSSMLAAAGRSWWQTMAGWLWTAPTPAPAPAAAAAAPARHASKLRRKSSRPASAGGPDGSGITNTYPRATYEIRSGLGPEMPVIHPAYARRASYRYAFCVLASSRMPFEALAKVDVVAGTQIEWRSNGCFPSEPVVVPRPGGVDEDDACILSVVLDGAARASFVLVLDARTFTEIGRASFQIGGVVPFGFHGTFTDQLGGSDP